MATFQDVLDAVASAAGGSVQGADVTRLLDIKTRSDSDIEWRYSVIDLMKALGLQSDLSSRVELARDLGYGGPLNGSAEMNIWLHKRILAKVDEAGAKVPADLKG